MRVLLFVAGLLIGTIFGRAAGLRTISAQRKTIRSLRVGKEPKQMETMKKVVWICLGNGIAWVWCSYVLAAFDRVQIAESLSQVAVTSIIGVVFAYAAKSVFENLSKNNHWPDKNLPPSEQPETDDDSVG